jgi:hypothetical protein
MTATAQGESGMALKVSAKLQGCITYSSQTPLSTLAMHVFNHYRDHHGKWAAIIVAVLLRGPRLKVGAFFTIGLKSFIH